MPSGKIPVASRLAAPQPGKFENSIFLLQNFMQLV